MDEKLNELAGQYHYFINVLNLYVAKYSFDCLFVVAHTQLIANQCQMRVIVDDLATKQSTKDIPRLSINEILAFRSTFPLEQLQYLDKELKENESYRHKVVSIYNCKI